MKKLLITSAIALALSTSLIATPVMAASDTNKEEAIGVGTGVVIGAIVAGPVGAFIGALTGGLIGQAEGDKKEIALQDRQLTAQHSKLVALREKTANYDNMLAQNEQLGARLAEIEVEKLALQKQRINNLMAMTVQFRTGSSEIEPHFAQQLTELASVLKQNPELQLDLNGFADQRGNEKDNLALSKSRVVNVQSYLIKQGVKHNRLNSHAFGETQSIAKNKDFEGDFFDRRVTVKARSAKDQSQTASNQY